VTLGSPIFPPSEESFFFPLCPFSHHLSRGRNVVVLRCIARRISMLLDLIVLLLLQPLRLWVYPQYSPLNGTVPQSPRVCIPFIRPHGWRSELLYTLLSSEGSGFNVRFTGKQLRRFFLPSPSPSPPIFRHSFFYLPFFLSPGLGRF